RRPARLRRVADLAHGRPVPGAAHEALAAGPFGPWVAGGDDEPAPEPTPEARRLIAAGVYDVAVLYEALADARNMGPREVDELFLWECAVLLKVHRPAKDGDDATPAPKDSRAERLERLKARVAHARGEGPKPEADVMTADALTEI